MENIEKMNTAKVTDAEILKALECCGNFITSSCKGCPYHSKHNASCVRALMHDALDLINRQKAEVEQWKDKYMNLWCEPDSDIHKIKLEAVKMFVKKLKAIAITIGRKADTVRWYEISDIAIDNLLEEMEGEGNV